VISVQFPAQPIGRFQEGGRLVSGGQFQSLVEIKIVTGANLLQGICERYHGVTNVVPLTDLLPTCYRYASTTCRTLSPQAPFSRDSI